MKSSIFFAGLMAIFSAVPVQSERQWTVSDARRSKSNSNTVCTWHFTVADSGSAGDVNTFNCDFKAQSVSGTDCGASSFDAPCSGNAAFHINGGHSDQGFIVMVLSNRNQDSKAYFGFSDTALDTAQPIPKQTKGASPQGTVRRDETAVRRQGGGKDVTPVEEWRVIDLFREVNVSKHEITVGFTLMNDSLSGALCMITLYPPDGVNMSTWEWYDRRCEGSNYFVSWGYMNSSDAGIMTIVNATRDGQAFFGFPDISSSAFLGDAGPSPVSWCKCG
ncbi:hypothetical protein F5Y04DRAFT_168083 [Hypomontagnella monticulosa]|nr:hypothetical protein F5Y04DRAFT_168083 [Hypomontagnella monticulosa]